METPTRSRSPTATAPDAPTKRARSDPLPTLTPTEPAVALPTFNTYDLLWLKCRAMTRPAGSDDYEYDPDPEDEYPDDVYDGGVPNAFKGRLTDLEYMNKAIAAMRVVQAECVARHEADLKKRDDLWAKIDHDLPEWTEFKETLTADELELFKCLGIESDYDMAKHADDIGYPRSVNCKTCFGHRHLPGGDQCDGCMCGSCGGPLVECGGC